MRRHPRTYRAIAILAGFLLLAAVSLPTGVSAAHCDLSQPVSSTTHNHDPEPKSHASDHGHQAGDTDSDTDCDVGLNCSCCTDQHTVNTRSPNPFSRIKADLSTVATGILDQATPVTATVQHANLEHQAGDASPPIFLKNSTFLN
ncbi:hypothetical protein ACG2F4_12795 [Halalkalibaculum sp. DA3122]|uniref:hypothetical protein n=1 Tax=Halalkalibaculum sp. DA3122 TaxID=3373607 RepID=UPI003754D201